MDCVVDASVALKWLVAEEDSAQAQRLLQDGIRLHAPHFLEMEVANALWKKVDKKIIDPDAALALNKKFLGLDIRWQAGKWFGEKTLLLALLSKHSVYDFTYFMLAVHLGCPLVTADQRFAGALREFGFSEPPGIIVPLEDFDPDTVRRIPAG